MGMLNIRGTSNTRRLPSCRPSEEAYRWSQITKCWRKSRKLLTLVPLAKLKFYAEGVHYLIVPCDKCMNIRGWLDGKVGHWFVTSRGMIFRTGSYRISKDSGMFSYFLMIYNEIQKAATLDTVYVLRKLLCKSTEHSPRQITLHVP